MAYASGNFLIISDTQMPFEAPGALPFCKQVQREFKVPAENVYHVGDELDCYHGSGFKKTPDAKHTPVQELESAKEKLLKWYQAFPQMKLAISNHGLRWVKKAIEAEIPSQMLVPYRQIIEAPESWEWKEQWTVNARYPFRIIHGQGYSGQMGAINATLDGGMSTAIGHLHGHAGISIVRRAGVKAWAMNVGCLVDESAYAFEYGKYYRNRACLSVGVVIDHGLTPILIPYERMSG